MLLYCIYVEDRGKPPVAQGPCWFCLGSPEVDKHLVVSVGEQVCDVCIRACTLICIFLAGLNAFFCNTIFYIELCRHLCC